MLLADCSSRQNEKCVILTINSLGFNDNIKWKNKVYMCLCEYVFVFDELNSNVFTYSQMNIYMINYHFN